VCWKGATKKYIFNFAAPSQRIIFLPLRNKKVKNMVVSLNFISSAFKCAADGGLPLFADEDNLVAER
jgi:hypothetical protein